MRRITISACIPGRCNKIKYYTAFWGGRSWEVTRRREKKAMHRIPTSLLMFAILVVLFSTTSSNDVSRILNLSIRETLSDNDDDDNGVNLFLKRFKCFVNICGELSSEYGYAELWAKTNIELQDHFDAFRNCSKQWNPLLIQA